MTNKIIIIGSGNAAMCAGIAALERGASVVMYEKAEKILAGGNTKYTAVYLVFPPARIFSAFSYITTDAPRSNAAMPAHIAAFPEPIIIILFVIRELFPKNLNN